MSVKPAASGWVSASPNRALEEAAATRPEALVCVLHAEVSQELNGSRLKTQRMLAALDERSVKVR